MVLRLPKGRYKTSIAWKRGGDVKKSDWFILNVAKR